MFKDIYPGFPLDKGVHCSPSAFTDKVYCFPWYMKVSSIFTPENFSAVVPVASSAVAIPEMVAQSVPVATHCCVSVLFLQHALLSQIYCKFRHKLFSKICRKLEIRTF